MLHTRLLGLFLLIALCRAWIAPSPRRSLHQRDMAMMSTLADGRNQKLEVNGGTLCFDASTSKYNSQDSPIVYLPGLAREKNEGKSMNLQSWCKKVDMTFLSADYYGVGRSTGKFEEGSVGRWADDTISLIEKTVGSKNKVVLVGGGVGAWISFVVASRRPDLVRGIVGLSADPDFTEELLMKTLPDEEKTKIMNDGIAEITWGNDKYPISRNLIEDGKKNLLLTGGPGSLDITCPVRLIHAIDDEEVPFSLALKLVANVKSSDASVVLLKSETHSLDSEAAHKTMRSMVTEVLTAYTGAFDLTSPGSG
jgi:pimeloyl-ACP methyl ester carboxylesterase